MSKAEEGWQLGRPGREESCGEERKETEAREKSSCTRRTRHGCPATPLVASSPGPPMPLCPRPPQAQPQAPGAWDQGTVYVWKRQKSRQRCAEKGEAGEAGEGPLLCTLPTLISDRLLFHVPTPTPTPRFQLVKKPVGWAGAGPGEGPVIQVWGQEGRCERNQLGAPTPGLSSHSSLP